MAKVPLPYYHGSSAQSQRCDKQVFQAPECWNGILRYFAKYGLEAFVNSGSKINA